MIEARRSVEPDELNLILSEGKGCHKLANDGAFDEWTFTNKGIVHILHTQTRGVKVSITVEHDKRKREILEKSLDVFMDEGFEDTTFQKIAERCGITRTILYLYFKNKREIFNFSIKLFTDRLESTLKEIAADTGLSRTDRLAAIIERTISDCIDNRRLLMVIHDYLGHVRTAGGNPDERVRRRTIRMKHLIAGILIDGQRAGEFGRFSIKAASELLYSLIEAEIFRLTVLGRQDAGSIPQAARLIAESFRAMAGPSSTEVHR